jgi:hypothetical protein
VSKVPTICFVVAMIGIFFANGSSNAMKRLVYNRSGKSFRVLSRQLVREYRAYCFSMLAFFLGIAGFVVFPK